MAHLLGLDPSLAKSGYVVLDIANKGADTVERGLLKTSRDDGILVQRLILQSENVATLIAKHNIHHIGMEAPFFGGGSSEMLYALNQYLHRVFLETEVFVVCFPPQMLKKLVYPDRSVTGIKKAHMIHAAKTALGLQGKKLAEDVADAYWAGVFGRRYYRWQIEKSLPTNELGEYEKHVFCGKHEYTKGEKSGSTDLTGIVYRENELFFDFKAIKRRSERGLQKDQEETEGKR